MEALEDIPEPPKIRVVIRKRPLTQREGQSQDIVDVEGVGELSVKEIKYVYSRCQLPLLASSVTSETFSAVLSLSCALASRV